MPYNEEVPALGSLRLALDHLSPVRPMFLIGATLIVSGSLLSLLQPLATGWVLADFDQGGSGHSTMWLLSGILLATLTVNYVGSVLLLRGTERVVARSRDRLVMRIVRLTVGQMALQNPGDLQTRVTSDATVIRLLLSTSLVQVITACVSIVGAMFLMSSIDPFMLVATLCAMGMPASVLLISMPRIKRWALTTQRSMGRLGATLEKTLGSFTTVKAHDAVEYEEHDLRERIDDVRQSGARSAVWRATTQTVAVVTMQAAYVMALVAGGIEVQRGGITVPALVTFLMYTTQLSAPAITLSAAFSSFQTAQAAMIRMQEVEEMEGEDRRPRQPVPPARTDDAPVAELDHVRFSYPYAAGVSLADLDLSFPQRGLIALVGPSGCGKSTVLRLLSRFYPVDEGVVRVDGVDVEEWPLGPLRQRVALVEQDAPAFEGTLRSNLLYGHPDPDSVSDEECHEAMQLMQCDDLGPLDTVVGYRGGTLSGGQRQRLALARGVLRRPGLLLLDEPTAALDHSTEERVLESLRLLSMKTSVVMVAHRSAAIRAADRVAVMEDGRLRVIGTHAEVADDEVYQVLLTDDHEMVPD